MPQPNKIPRPFADSGDKNSIPESSGALGFASWQEGFPAITGTPFAQGGVAPKRADFNGVFNALSAATVWNQQGGVYAYDAITDYEVGNIAEKNGSIYICKTANGPGSAVKDPATDTAETYWGRLYPQNGTFNRMFYSQTSGSYTAPNSGVYRVTLKGGGGGGGAAGTAAGGCGGGEGGTVIFYASLVASQSYQYVIGGGGSGGIFDGTTAQDGGASSFAIGSDTVTADGGISGATSYLAQGGGGSVPPGYNAVIKRGASGVMGTGNASGASFIWGGAGAGEGGGTVGRFARNAADGSGGGGGGGSVYSGTPKDGTNGGGGYILIEYAG